MCAFVSVWVVGCNLTLDPPANATPTPSPQITLTVGRVGPPPPSITIATTRDDISDPAMETVEMRMTPLPEQSRTPIFTPTPLIYAVQSGDTLLDIAIRYDLTLEQLRVANPQAVGLLQVGQNLQIPPTPSAVNDAANALPTDPVSVAPASLALIVYPPMCYRARRFIVSTMPSPDALAEQRIVCLGKVENTLETTAERVSVLIALDVDATTDERSAAVEQARILPGEQAAYHTFFTLPSDASITDTFPARATLQTADAAPDEGGFIALDIIDANGEWHGDQFVLTATLINGTDAVAVEVRAFVTLSSPTDESETEIVIGYRIGALPNTIMPGERAALRVAVIPLIPAPTSDAERAATRYTLAVEARRQ